ncbi:MAG: hypothetical protein QME05_06770 [Candidatus Margulisbacteria bacterium]|nr:hypothetical protein [Candidatus Margulisiibacteriota bacterium]
MPEKERLKKLLFETGAVKTGEFTLSSAVEKAGCKVIKVISVVDREEGAKEALANYAFDPIFIKSGLISA